jgi:hypothetical protein
VDGSLGFDLTATITSVAAALNPSSMKTFYRLNGGSFFELALTATPRKALPTFRRRPARLPLIAKTRQNR